MMRSADLVLLGTVLTVDDAQPTAEAGAVTDGLISAVGRRADVEGSIGSHTQVPGFVEAATRSAPAGACWHPGSG